ncbi:Apolipoprotein C-II [Sciurus carolinensis]|uniref:Apolipoprotein C-II n=1 Tax=Sciurus carolinensis TaxID=30640 RepID=A0AA41MTY2_SCICA|nr:apolipoprotein C-II [Sciurus carolinensis]MBZ3878118.1 Apolipoprotein C-II [Sciurus carolinensis]
MGTRFLLALFLVLLVLGCEVQGAQLPPQDEPASLPLLAQVQESLSSYWGTAKEAAQGLYQKTYLNDMDEKIRDLYSKGSAAMSTYAGIFTDQLLTLLKGD